MNRSSQYIRLWLYSGILLVASMVLVGGITRLTGSGLSMVEWKPVTGVVPPLNETEWETEFDKYKQFPEYQKYNYHMTLAEFKQIFFWEYVHRLLGRLIGVVFLVPFVIFYVKGWISKALRWPLLGIFALGGLQGFVGWYMVKSGLSTQPYVSHFRLALHQGLALLLLSAIFWITLSLNKTKRTRTLAVPWLSIASWASLFLLALQITWGAFVAGLKAGYSYNNFPMMGEHFFPNSDLVSSATYFHNGPLIQFTHRWLGFLVLTAFLILYRLSRTEAEVKQSVRVLVMVALAQVTLGVLTLWWSVPLALGVIHQLVAVFVLMAMIRVLHVQRYEPIKGDAN